ncbi:uncharacterized protein LOC130648228 [Hydractinia symbiolongicarpus]|uniref:uncharacterized protein LOC130648228 n=1 Tax=Hydractinia symbiolongicarpus TaxID=13093 RepID=UPI00254D49B1|nr:uncharacterized protein LOC130648228 [Hydractinia symbiolongicarpus]
MPAEPAIKLAAPTQLLSVAPTNLRPALDRIRTTPSDIDFNIISRSSPPITIEIASSNETSLKNWNLKPCKVVLQDVLAAGSTEKSKLLKANLDKTHSVLSHQPADIEKLKKIEKKQQISWPKSGDTGAWSALNNAAQPTHAPSGLNRRALQSISVIKEKNSLLQQLENVSDLTQREHLQTSLSNVKLKLTTLRRGEQNRKKRWKIHNANRAFGKNPYKAGKDLLDPKCSIRLNVPKESLDAHKASVLIDPLYEIPLSTLPGLPNAPNVTSPFDFSKFNFKDFQTILHTRRNASSPGLNQISYTVYKNCPQIASFLFNLFQSCLKNSYIPVQWRVALKVYIPKNKPPSPSSIKDFRPIALLNVEEKLFFSLVSKRLENHIIQKNHFINKSIQKGCMEKVPGCWEHMSLVWAALRNAKSRKNALSAIWLDVANAYPTLPHKLIFMALCCYGISESWIRLINAYYGSLWSKSFSFTAPSSWHRHFRGIFIGCTLSIILFLAAINVIIEYVCAEEELKICVPPGDSDHPPVKAFMDDIFLMSSSLPQTQNLLDRCVTALHWAGMGFRPSKSRNIVIANGNVLDQSPFCVLQEPIPSIYANPVKFLGRTINSTLSDSAVVQQVIVNAVEQVKLIDNSSHRGIHKVWFLHHLLIPRIRWPFLIYEVPISRIVSLEQKFSFFIRKWPRLHHSISNISFYSASSLCPLPLKSLSSVLKSAKISGHLLLPDSADALVSDSPPDLKAGHWKVDQTVKSAKSQLEFKKILGFHQFGLGLVSHKSVPPIGTHSYRKLVSDVVQDNKEDIYYARAVQLHVQGNWTKWCSFIKFDLSWKNLLSLPQSLSSFCIGATYDTLPSPTNLAKWGIQNDKSCTLCKKPSCNVSHILGACKLALSQAGTRLPTKKRSKIQGILHLASDWRLLSDLDSTLIVPPYLAVTQLCPDILLTSAMTKTVIILELTCPCKENMETWHGVKVDKYSSFCSVMRLNNWFVHFFAVEVGARGFCSETVRICLRRLGFSNMSVRSTLKSLTESSIRRFTSGYLEILCLGFILVGIHSIPLN